MTDRSSMNADDEAAHYRQALEDIANPLDRLRREAEAAGSRLSGQAFGISNDPFYLKRLAREALSAAKREARP